LGATNTKTLLFCLIFAQNRSHGGEPDKVSRPNFVPRRTKKRRRRRRRRTRRPSVFFFLFEGLEHKKSFLKKRKKGKKTLTFEENWEKKKTRQSAVCRTKRRRSSAQHARTFSRSEPSVTMFTLSTSATVSSVRASRLLCVSAFSNRMAAMSPLAYVFLLARKPEGGEISFVSLAREGKGTRCDGFLGKKELELCGEKTLSCSLQVFCPVRSP